MWNHAMVYISLLMQSKTVIQMVKTSINHSNNYSNP